MAPVPKSTGNEIKGNKIISATNTIGLNLRRSPSGFSHWHLVIRPPKMVPHELRKNTDAARMNTIFFKHKIN